IVSFGVLASSIASAIKYAPAAMKRTEPFGLAISCPIGHYALMGYLSDLKNHIKLFFILKNRD
ncbi:MAG TPA: hypothetical protein VKW78_11305, partial [Terriglobales bacterium]|nr:hypothetical protein [Terriglobales bacterium]